MALATVVAAASIARPALAQNAPSAPVAQTPRVTLDPGSLERVSQGLAMAPKLKLTAPAPRFYSQTVFKQQTFAEYFKTWNLAITPIAAPSPNGGHVAPMVDVFALVSLLFPHHPDAEAAKLRHRIDAELKALSGH